MPLVCRRRADATPCHAIYGLLIDDYLRQLHFDAIQQ